jgi:hypothetical protein
MLLPELAGFDTLTPARGHLSAEGSIRKLWLDCADSLGAGYNEPKLAQMPRDLPHGLIGNRRYAVTA